MRLAWINVKNILPLGADEWKYSPWYFLRRIGIVVDFYIILIFKNDHNKYVFVCHSMAKTKQIIQRIFEYKQIIKLNHMMGKRFWSHFHGSIICFAFALRTSVWTWILELTISASNLGYLLDVSTVSQLILITFSRFYYIQQMIFSRKITIFTYRRYDECDKHYRQWMITDGFELGITCIEYSILAAKKCRGKNHGESHEKFWLCT